MSCLRSSCLFILVILAVVSSTTFASCHISKEWSSDIVGRSQLDVSAILPAPYCLLLSDREDGTNYHYALRVENGSMAWQWPAYWFVDTQMRAAQLAVSVDPDRVYALVTYERWPQLNTSTCGTLAALHSGNGTVIWQHELCMVNGEQPGFAVMQPPLSNTTQGERLVLVITSNNQYPVINDGVAEVLDGNTGRLLSSSNVSDGYSLTIVPVGQGREGYFTVRSFGDLTPVLHRLMPDNSINQSSSFYSAMLTDAVLRSEPALLHENSTTNKSTVLLVARDVATDEQVWSSSDEFLVGRNWGTNGTFTHFSTVYQLVDALPELFIIINAAYNGDDHGDVKVVAQAGVYQLSTGKEVSRSALLVFDHLYHPESNPTTWQFDDMLLLRGDTVWYTLQLPLLRLVGSGHYATHNASQLSNNWLVDPDGSYVALPYGITNDVYGYPPFVDQDDVETDGHSASELSSAQMQHRHAKRG